MMMMAIELTALTDVFPKNKILILNETTWSPTSVESSKFKIEIYNKHNVEF